MYDTEKDVRKIDISVLEKLLRSGQKDKCRSTLTGFFEQIGYEQLDSLMLRLYITMDIYISAKSYSNDLGISNERFTEQFGNLDDITIQLSTLQSTLDYFSIMLEQCISWRIEVSHDDGSGIIRKAREYIDGNYSDEEISLRTVANEINLSHTYFSALFKKETGMKFIDYLTEVRVEKAKELLCRTSMQVSEIAYMVGFRDYRYFGQIFKKHTGKTPREFQYTSNVK